MCDVFLQNYAALLNERDGTLIPQVLLFSEKNCGGSVYPNSNNLNGDLVNAPSVDYYQTFSSFPGNAAYVLSMYIPFNFKVESLQFPQYHVYGPTVITDTTQPGAMYFPFRVVELVPWSTLQQNLCMGQQAYIGVNPLTKYTGGQPFCDDFMRSWCSDPEHLSLDACSCLRDQPQMTAWSAKFGQDFPVVCFSYDCATKASYQTQDMQALPCNSVLCRQIINASPTLFNQGQLTLFCNGETFDASMTQTVTPTVSIATTVPATTVSVTTTTTPVVASDTFKLFLQSEPLYTWLLLVVTVMLLITFLVVVAVTYRRKMQQARESHGLLVIK